jgi:hypothetical protein
LQGRAIEPFIDKNTGKHYESGEVYSSSDPERIDELKKRGFVEFIEKEDGLIHVGGGYYELPNGEKVKGKEKALETLKEIE